MEEKTKKTHEIVIEHIKQLILQGDLKKGNKLPSERTLSADLNVSRTSIRDALKTLEVIGILDRCHGGGTYIREDFDDFLSGPLSVLFAFNKIEKREILELRKMVESEIAYLAAQKITDSEISILRDCFNNMKSTEYEAVSVKFDRIFHYTLAKAADNHIIMSLYNVITQVLEDFIEDVRYYVALENDQLVYDIHRDILDAIESRDAERAKKTMEAHMDIVSKYYEKNMKE